MVFFKKSILLATATLSIFFYQGCQESTTYSYSTTLGEATSIGTKDTNTIISPSSNIIKSITHEVAKIIEKDINSFNQKIAIEFTKEINYCDISGLKELESSGDIQNITTHQLYDSCQEERTLQNGKINVHYREMNEEGRYPKKIILEVDEDYQFNSIILKQGVTIESFIVYNLDKTIQEVYLKINGELNFNSISYLLQNITETITYERAF